MIPAHLAQEMIRACNLALWSTEDHREQAQGLMLALGQYIRLYGGTRVRDICGADPYRLYRKRNENKQLQPMLLTMLRLLPALGVRVRIEADPNPRNLMRPASKKVRHEERMQRLREEDPTGQTAAKAGAIYEAACARAKLRQKLRLRERRAAARAARDAQSPQSPQ